MFLRVKDNIDLKRLEEFDFKLIEVFSSIDCYENLEEINELENQLYCAGDVVISPESRIVTGVDVYDINAFLCKIFDLTKAGILEKIDKDNL